MLVKCCLTVLVARKRQVCVPNKLLTKLLHYAWIKTSLRGIVILLTIKIMYVCCFSTYITWYVICRYFIYNLPLTFLFKGFKVKTTLATYTLPCSLIFSVGKSKGSLRYCSTYWRIQHYLSIKKFKLIESC